MEERNFKVYGYRWAVLLAFMFVVATNQMAWITFAPITNAAAKFYDVSVMSIGLLSLSFMAVYIIVSIPASWVIDTYGIKVAVGFGAILTAIFGLLRGVPSFRFGLVLAAQIGIAIGQPFILNSVTKVAARWFPMEERATAVGIGTLAMYLGIIIGMVVTPLQTIHYGISKMLLIYGALALASAITFFAVVREHPPTPPGPPEMEERALMFDGLKIALSTKDFLLLMVVFFIGLGAFNGITTWIEELVRPRGFTISQAGMAGGLMVLFGVLGALVLPPLSDRTHRRIPFVIAALIGAAVGMFGLAFVKSYPLLLISSAVMGFFLLSAAPIGFQYGAEVAYPAPEGTTNGLLLMAGQISGVLFIIGMGLLKSPKTGSMTGSMLGLIALTVLAAILCFTMKEPKIGPGA